MSEQSERPAAQPTHPPPGHRPMPGDEDMVAIRAQLRLFLVLILGLFVVMTQRLPFRLGGILLAVAALWVGFKLIGKLRRLRRAGRRTPGAFTLFIGVTLSAMLLLLLVADAVYYPLVADLETCQAAANTEQAQELCQQQASNRIDQLVERFTNRTTTR